MTSTIQCQAFAGDGPHYSCLLCGREGVEHEGVVCTNPNCWTCRLAKASPDYMPAPSQPPGETLPFIHVDDYLDSGSADPIAKEYLEHARRPAVDKDSAWLHANRPYVAWRGQEFRCVGASRMGDVWLKGNGPKNAFYDHRVNVAELSNWRRP